MGNTSLTSIQPQFEGASTKLGATEQELLAVKEARSALEQDKEQLQQDLEAKVRDVTIMKQLILAMLEREHLNPTTASSVAHNPITIILTSGIGAWQEAEDGRVAGGGNGGSEGRDSKV